jgi:hypothetical protein
MVTDKAKPAASKTTAKHNGYPKTAQANRVWMSRCASAANLSKGWDIRSGYTL